MKSSREFFIKSFEEAIETIDMFANTPSDFNELVKWMLETDANPYSYLGEVYGKCFDSAEAFAGMLQTLHHAVVDDGDVCFITVNGQPRIVFAFFGDEGFENYALSSTEKRMKEQGILGKPVEYKIEWLEILPNEFPNLYIEWWKKDLKRCFMWDAKRNIEWAKDIYKSYSVFDESWVVEAKEKYCK
jgi:hypothetical protein